MKTATIPHISTPVPTSAKDLSSLKIVTATEDELAKMSEQTLERLSNRVKNIASETDVHDAEPTLETVAEPRRSDDAVDLATQSLVNIVLERSSPSTPVVLLFVGSEPNHHVDELTARVASALCEHSKSRVLLIDSDNVNRNLTQAARQEPQQGMTEIIEFNMDWRTNLIQNENSNLDFIPTGNAKFGRWNEKELLRRSVGEMKTDYQFVCVAGGDAHGEAAKVWSDVCDGSYLLVSIKNTNGMVAKSAVAELKSNGARLLGCVVTDVDNA